ncbi:hypothetical protein FC49_GL001736 [Limosilactobacillus oris DSM 4864]|uniref:Uncharacterized protein n=1 Tax=Limosilactobacillus oris DSM 4864 TaxID=1423779 RepID=A0A0R1WGC1_9LACO|nr:hypothetical protein FC49_GL001736 [Limosilactobacillus oris DSM 4864]
MKRWSKGIDGPKAIFKHWLATAWAVQWIRLNEVDNDSIALVFNRFGEMFVI